MLTRILHAIAADARVYDLIRFVFGSRLSERRLRTQAAEIVASSSRNPLVVLDVGGGTGRLEAIWPPDALYICLDPDRRKIEGFVQRHGSGVAVIGSGKHLPFRDGSIDVALLIAVSHHLADDVLDNVVREIHRVLRPDGRLIYLDAIWNPHHLTGRILWRYDRGAFPRPIQRLRARLQRYYTCQTRERYAMLHDYILWVGRPIPRPTSENPTLKIGESNR
jgi:SAM-dependent methyltransferase